MSNKFKKKPTIREVANIVVELSNKLNSLMGFLSELEKAFSLYIEMNNDAKKFTDFIDKKLKEAHDAKRNGDTNGDNIPSNTEDEGSRSERVREEAK
jgi:hypothetical protein